MADFIIYMPVDDFNPDTWIYKLLKNLVQILMTLLKEKVQHI